MRKLILSAADLTVDSFELAPALQDRAGTVYPNLSGPPGGTGGATCDDVWTCGNPCLADQDEEKAPAEPDSDDGDDA